MAVTPGRIFSGINGACPISRIPQVGLFRVSILRHLKETPTTATIGPVSYTHLIEVFVLYIARAQCGITLPVYVYRITGDLFPRTELPVGKVTPGNICETLVERTAVFVPGVSETGQILMPVVFSRIGKGSADRIIEVPHFVVPCNLSVETFEHVGVEILFRQAESSLIAVSYTHLDVYKRQVP